MKPSAPLRLALICAIALLASCERSKSQRDLTMTPADFASARWEDVVREARGTEVGFGMWAGDEDRNHHFRSGVSERLKSQFGITLRIVPNGDTAEAVNKLINEKGAGKSGRGAIDLLWINGENFQTAKQAGVLWGPFSSHVPNVRLYDEDVSKRDFGTLIDGLEAPWQKAQFVMAYDTARFTNPPSSIPALRTWIRAHPGRFTYIAPPDYTGSAFIRHILVHFGHGDPDFWNGFHEELYQRASAGTIAYLNEVKPFLWRRGATYPSTPTELDRLFANREVDFAMSYGPGFASRRIARGEFPPTARTFVFKDGAIGNYSFLAIPFNAGNIAGALVTLNALMSFDEAIEFSRTLDSAFPHRLDRLPPQQRALAEALPRGPATLAISDLSAHFLPEPDAEYLNHLEKDWSAKVLQQ
jgi:putative spermidine/putrescine transport system substrate-binding protein